MSLGTIELMSKMMLKYQTPMVGLWHCLTFIGRLLPINICQGIYGDDQYMFKCDTMHTGCLQLCFNRHSPISHVRFFNMLILFIGLPKILFHLYAAKMDGRVQKSNLRIQKSNQEAMKKYQEEMTAYQQLTEKEGKVVPAKPEPIKAQETKKKIMRNTYQGNAAEVNWPTEIARAHVLHFIVIFIIEIFGLIALNWLQQAQMSTYPRTFFDIESYDVPEMYQCRLHEPGKPSLKNCGNGEFQYCYVTRPTEKKMFLYYMITTAIVSIILMTIDLIYVLQHHTRKRANKKKAQSQQSIVKNGVEYHSMGKIAEK